MPPIVVAFFLLFGGALAPDFVKGLDPRPHGDKRGAPVETFYRTWTSTAPMHLTEGDTCPVVFFAMTNSKRAVRARLDGEEQLLDTSWTKEVAVRAGRRRHFKAEFIDAESGRLLACQEVNVRCYGRWTSLDLEDERAAPPCTPDAKVPKKNLGDARLVLTAPPMTMSIAGEAYATVIVTAEIQGEITEDWYCPGIRFDWPDDTHSVRESDCVPFSSMEAKDIVRRWPTAHHFPAGTWKVRACLFRTEKDFACAETTVRVIGTDDYDQPF